MPTDHGQKKGGVNSRRLEHQQDYGAQHAPTRGSYLAGCNLIGWPWPPGAAGWTLI